MTTDSGTRFHLKDPSVEYKGSAAQEAILDAAAKVYAASPQPLVVTSANDGSHIDGSLHYEDRALDLRTWKIRDPGAAAAAIGELLGCGYDVIAEDTHIHAEHDPA
jgi:hypothetical protein